VQRFWVKQTYDRELEVNGSDGEFVASRSFVSGAPNPRWREEGIPQCGTLLPFQVANFSRAFPVQKSSIPASSASEMTVSTTDV
jgi:hypothetical protein